MQAIDGQGLVSGGQARVVGREDGATEVAGQALNLVRQWSLVADRAEELLLVPGGLVIDRFDHVVLITDSEQTRLELPKRGYSQVISPSTYVWKDGEGCELRQLGSHELMARISWPPHERAWLREGFAVCEAGQELHIWPYGAETLKTFSIRDGVCSLEWNGESLLVVYKNKGAEYFSPSSSIYFPREVGNYFRQWAVLGGEVFQSDEVEMHSMIPVEGLEALALKMKDGSVRLRFAGGREKVLAAPEGFTLRAAAVTSQGQLLLGGICNANGTVLVYKDGQWDAPAILRYRDAGCVSKFHVSGDRVIVQGRYGWTSYLEEASKPPAHA